MKEIGRMLCFSLKALKVRLLHKWAVGYSGKKMHNITMETAVSKVIETGSMLLSLISSDFAVVADPTHVASISHHMKRKLSM